MKKHIHKSISLILTVSMLSFCLAGCKAATDNDENTSADTSSDATDTKTLPAAGAKSAADAEKDETVYVEMAPDGTVTKTTVSNVLKISGKDNISDYSTLDNITNISGDEAFSQDSNGDIIWENKGEDISYQGTTTKSAPIDIKITYYLDNKEISPDELAGKSGKVKIVYDYTNNSEQENNRFIPFIVTTGMVLNEDHFSNVQAENGKIIEHNGSDIVIGYAVPGLKDEMRSLIANADNYIEDIDIPESFTVTADVSDFTMDMTLTAAVSDIGDFDPGEAFDLSDTEDQMDELQDGADKLADGSGDLNDGAKKLVKGSDKINSGAKDLSGYTSQLAAGTKKLNINYAAFNKAILDGLKTADSGVKELYTGSKEVEKGASDLDTGAGALDTGAQKLKDGADSLDKGAKTLAAGITQAKAAFEDSEESKGLVSGGADLYEGTKNANTGVKQVVQSMQGTPEAIQASIDSIITNLAPFGIDSVQQLDATVSAVNDAVKNSGASLDLTIAGTALKTTDNYYSLLNAYYSVHTLEQVKAQLSEQIQASEQDITSLLSGMNSLESGAQTLSGGINKLYEGVKQLDTGAKDLTAGTGTLSLGAIDLKKGTADLKGGTAKLSKGASTLSQGIGTLSAGTKTLNTKVGAASPKLKSGISEINDAAKAISKGAGTLSDGTQTLNDGIITLADGTKELKDGAVKLNDEGISKITDIFGKDAKDAVDAVEDTLNVGKEYNSFSGIADGMNGEVKFIFKTEEIN